MGNKRVSLFFLLSIMCVLISSCKETETTVPSLTAINIEKVDEYEETTLGTSETKTTGKKEFYCDIRAKDDLYIEGVMGDGSVDVELCVKLPRNYENQKVNIYKVNSKKYIDWNPNSIEMPGWRQFNPSACIITNGMDSDGDNYVYMSDEDVDSLVESFEWKETGSIPGYSEIGFKGKKYVEYTPYYKSPASDYYDYRIDDKKIIGLREKPFGVYTVREELCGLPVGTFFNYDAFREKNQADQTITVKDSACWSIYFYDGENVLDSSILALEDYEVEEEKLSIKPLEEVIPEAFPAIKSFLIPNLYGKRIRIYAAELAYLQCFSGDEWGTPQIDSNGEAFVSYRLVPFWILYYQTDMSVDGYQREVAVINAVTGEGIY